LYDLHWATVKRLHEQYLHETLGPVDLSGIEVIAMDEFAIQKGHRYATVIVDPHTLDKMGGIPRAERRAKGFITAIEPHVVALRKKYGKGIDRDVWNRVHAAGPRIDVLLIEGEVGEAWKLFREVETAAAPHEEKLGPRIRTLRASLAKDATQRLDRVEQALAEGGQAKRNAKRELRNLAKALKGTDFERRAASLLDAAK